MLRGAQSRSALGRETVMEPRRRAKPGTNPLAARHRLAVEAKQAAGPRRGAERLLHAKKLDLE